MRQLPHMNELHKEYGPKGLHVFTLFAQGHPVSQIDALVAKSKIEYPIALDGEWSDKYPSPSLPQVWVIGVDGKIIYQGGKLDDAVLEKELAKVKYPGLGKASVAKEVEPAAKAFGKGNFAEAVKLAQTVIDGEFGDDAVNDAEYVVDRVNEKIKQLTQRAELAEVQKDFTLAQVCWNELATRFAGCEDAQEAPAHLKRLQEDKEAAKETAARRAMLVLMRDLNWEAADLDLEDAKVLKAFREKCIDAFDKLAKEHPGTVAAATATKFADTHREALKQPPAKKEEGNKEEGKKEEGK